jgi:hypothetical protein
MNSSKDDHQRTIAFAEIAFRQIKALRRPASPPHFEIWYAYATGYSPSLNQMINEMLARDGTLTEANIDHIYKTFISPTRFTDRIDHVGAQVRGEIEQVMAMVGSRQCVENARPCQRRPRHPHDRGKPGPRHQESGTDQQGAGGPAIRVQAGDFRVAGQPRGGADRKPDRSAHLAGKIASFSTRPRPRRWRKRTPGTSHSRSCSRTSITSRNSTTAMAT